MPPTESDADDNSMERVNRLTAL